MVIRFLTFFIFFISCKSEKDSLSPKKQIVAESSIKKAITIKNADSIKILDTLNWKIPREIEIPNSLRNQIEGIEKVLAIDFTGDGIDDYLCYTKDMTGNRYTIMENWIDSSYKILRKKEVLFEYDYKWFVDLDNDGIPEIIKAQGESEGIDYAFFRLDFSELNDKVLFYFNPIIEYENHFYWGYPWELNDLIIDNNRIKYTLEHSIIRDGEITRPQWQKKFPVIIFKGKNEDEMNILKGIRVFEIENLKDFKYLSMMNLKNLVI